MRAGAQQQGERHEAATWHGEIRCVARWDEEQPNSPRSPCTAPLSVKRASPTNGVNRMEIFS
ncbi:hypothetical protein [Xanthomonas oryzae pv. oryzae MAFF 311018]|nr:hypothetical protein [Xanthomonas oryzae pv. oryzae MAFF 311018]